MAIIDDFDQLFGEAANYSYSASQHAEITSHRRGLGHLFIDRLLSQLKIKNANLYPPHSNKDLRSLHRQIISASIPEHHKQSLLYYILRDVYTVEDISLINDFVDSCHLPARYWRCVEGFWYLDHFDWTNGVYALTHPAVTPPTFSEEVLSVLLQHAKSQHPDLPITYYHSVNPPLTNPQLADSFFSHLAHISVTEALYFLRSRPECDHPHLFQRLVREALAEYKDNERADRGLELIELPFTQDEEAWFEEHLLEGSGKTFHGARDAVMMRKMATGNFQQALEIGKSLKGRRIDDMTWEPIKNAIAEGLGPRKDVGVGSFE